MKKPLITVLIVAAMFLTFGIELLVPDLDGLVNAYGFSGDNMLVRPHVAFTSIFLHAGIVHLLSNVLVLLVFGVALEPEIGKKWYLAIFFGGALLGDALSLLFYPPASVAIGASAGIFALIGAGIFVKPFDFSVNPPMPLALLGIMYAVYNVYGFFAGPQDISYVGHLGGLIAGSAYGVNRACVKKGLIAIIAVLIILVMLPFAVRLLAV